MSRYIEVTACHTCPNKMKEKGTPYCGSLTPHWEGHVVPIPSSGIRHDCPLKGTPPTFEIPAGWTRYKVIDFGKAEKKTESTFSEEVLQAVVSRLTTLEGAMRWTESEFRDFRLAMACEAEKKAKKAKRK